MMRRECFDAVGGFDEQLPVNSNDVDLCLRLTAAGCRSLCVPHARLIHDESRSRGGHIDPADFVRSECSYGEYRCIDAKTGERKWQTYQPITGKSTRWGNVFTVQLGEDSDRYILFNELGDLIIARLTPQKYEEISRAHILDPDNKLPGRAVVWSHPAFANKSMFVRNDHEVVCVSLAASE